MCNSVRYLDCESAAKLTELVGGESHIAWLDDHPREMNSCLCSVDLEATLEQARFRWTRGVDPIEWTALKSSGAA